MHQDPNSTMFYRWLNGCIACLVSALMLSSLPATAQNSSATIESALNNLRTQPTKALSENQEIAIGSALATTILKGKMLDADPNVQRYVNELGRWLSLQSAQPKLPWVFAVLDDSSINAWSTPGGYVFITRGLLDLCADEAELAGLLAREIVFVAEHHPSQKLAELVQASPYAPMPTLGQQWLNKPLHSDIHYRADREGVVLAARAGIDPYGLVAWLYKAADLVATDSGFNDWKSIMPPTSLRIDQLQLAMGNQLDALTGKPSVSITDRLAMPRTRNQPAAVQTGSTPTKRTRRK